LELPQCELVLNRCDEAAEFDDTIDAQQKFDDDPSIVVFRKANKIGFFVVVTPEHEHDIKVLLYCEIILHNWVIHYLFRKWFGLYLLRHSSVVEQISDIIRLCRIPSFLQLLAWVFVA